MSPLTEPTKIVLRNGWQPMDPDAAAYITAVETADGQALEEPVKIAIDNFVLGCKADGIWNAIKASCILAGARTLNGALVPLAGTAPTNYNFVSGDYNRKTGLVGDGSTKYLDSNRNNNADPQNSHHLSAYVSSANSTDSNRGYIGCGFTDTGSSHIFSNYTLSAISSRSRSSSAVDRLGFITATGLLGLNRAGSSEVTTRASGVSVVSILASETPLNENIIVFGRNLAAQANGRLAFYSIGESLDLALLDARVTDLINAFASAIP